MYAYFSPFLSKIQLIPHPVLSLPVFPADIVRRPRHMSPQRASLPFATTAAWHAGSFYTVTQGITLGVYDFPARAGLISASGIADQRVDTFAVVLALARFLSSGITALLREGM